MKKRDPSHDVFIIIIPKQVITNAEEFTDAAWAFKITGNIMKMHDGDAIFKEFIEFTGKAYKEGLIKNANL